MTTAKKLNKTTSDNFQVIGRSRVNVKTIIINFILCRLIICITIIVDLKIHLKIYNSLTLKHETMLKLLELLFNVRVNTLSK